MTDQYNPPQATAPYPHKALIQAYLDGKTIQLHSGEGWYDLNPIEKQGNMPYFGQKELYRVKPEVKEVWLNLYKDPLCSHVHKTRKAAETVRTSSCIATIKVTYTEGHGLNHPSSEGKGL